MTENIPIYFVLVIFTCADGEHFSKVLIFDKAEFLVWNIKGLRHQAATIEGLRNETSDK